MFRSLKILAAVFLIPPAIFAGADTGELIRDAARRDSDKYLKQLLREGADPNAADIHGYTPLMHAAMYGSDRAAEALITGGADIDAVSHSGITALHSAVTSSYASLRTLKLLLENKANPRVRSNDYGSTPLMSAVFRQNSPESIERVRILLEYGADPNDKNLEKYDEDAENRGRGVWLGNTVLMLSAKTGQSEVVKILLEYGADPQTQRHDDHATAAELAERAGYAKIAALIREWKVKHQKISPNKALQLTPKNGAAEH